MKITIRQEGDHLMGQASGENALQGDFDVYPASETNFFIPVDGAQLTFVKDESGEVMSVIHQYPGRAGWEGRKMPALVK